jgi:deoxyribodipyrimidine photolyase-related protein
VKHFLPLFGRYQDALLDGKDPVQLYHSCLSPLLNRGILLPREVVDAVEAADHAPLSSREGFLRQILGWREYSLFVYECLPPISSKVLRKGKHLSDAWYRASTGLPPLDESIHRSFNAGYASHIERLMVIGNAMLLCGVSGEEATRWFMEPYLDAYPWVMAFNVQRMVLFLDQGQTTTRPYTSSSRYLRNMSAGRYKGGAWSDAWDALYTHLLVTRSKEWSKLRDMGLILSSISRMDPEEKMRRSSLARKIHKALVH